MIAKADLLDRVREWGLTETVVEKDYVIGWVLWGIGSHERLSREWAFKGGTCIKKCYIETYRFSEDLDFTVLPGGLLAPDDLLPVLMEVLDRVNQVSGIDFGRRAPLLRTRRDPASVEGRIYYNGPVGAPGVAALKIDLTSAERVVCPTVLRGINHHYPDALPLPASVRCYAFEELFAEKVRAMGQRSRPRDLYDIINLFRRGELLPHWRLIRNVYEEKCVSKGVKVFGLEDLESSSYRDQLESEWSNMLAHQLPVLPRFEDFHDELPRLFDWLSGRFQPADLEPVFGSGSEDESWSPPVTAWVWGSGVPFEPVRFAAANLLCVELVYEGSVCVIEPYSLRRTRDGDILLYGADVRDHVMRPYLVEAIMGVRVTSTPFRPRFKVDMTAFNPFDSSAVSASGGSARPGTC